MKTIFTIWTLLFLTSCNLYDRKQEVFISDNDYQEFYREYSPDSAMLLVNYGIDIGAFGYGQSGTAILKLSDTLRNLREFTLPNTFVRVKWIDNQSISAQYDIIPSLITGEKINLQDKVINNIKVKISALDYIDKDDHLEIELKEISPNGRFELIAYRYIKDRDNLNFIHISVVPVGQTIPRYGNYFIADMQSDYILGGSWTKKMSLNFTLTLSIPI